MIKKLKRIEAEEKLKSMGLEVFTPREFTGIFSVPYDIASVFISHNLRPGGIFIKLRNGLYAVKDAYHAPQPTGHEPPFAPLFVTLGRGAVNWRRALGALKVLGYDAAFSVHTAYDFDESIIRQVGYADTTPPHLEEWAIADAAYLRKVWAGRRSIACSWNGFHPFMHTRHVFTDAILV